MEFPQAGYVNHALADDLGHGQRYHIADLFGSGYNHRHGINLFYASMVGKSVAFDSNSYTITEYVSATSVKVSGDASSETSGFTITANGAYRLPSNFGGIHGTELTFDESDDYYPGVTLVDEFFVRRLRQQAEASGRPTHAAVRPVESDQSVKQKFELVVYPDVSTVYTLQYATNAYPEELSTSNPYPLGGPQHSEVIKACALAEAEKHERDGFMNWQSEARRLTVAAIKADARLLAAKSLGYNGNMRKIGSLSHRAFRNHIVTVQGEIPGES
jgi:hypothetical protein